MITGSRLAAPSSVGGRWWALGPLVPVTARALSWAPPAVAGLMAVGMVVHGVWTVDGDALTHLMRLRLTMVVLAAGAGFAFDDPAGPTVAASPVSLAHRGAVRLALTLLAWGAGWSTVLAVVATEGGPVPVVGLTIEALAWLAIAVTVGAWRGGAATGPALLAGYLLVARLPGRWALQAFPSTEQWSTGQQRWGFVALTTVALLAWALRDPARRWRLTRAG